MIIKPEICAIVAIGPDNVIGRDGVMPWHSATDFAHFRKTTIPYPCIFGRKTFENLPTRPLKNRLNLVVSSQYKNEYIDGVFYASSLERAISECDGVGRIFICGGAGVYQYALNHNLIETMYLTIIKNPVLLHDIEQNPGAYCRFPIDAKTFIKSPNWTSQAIIYPPKLLQLDDGLTITEFYKCTRVR